MHELELGLIDESYRKTDFSPIKKKQHITFSNASPHMKWVCGERVSTHGLRHSLHGCLQDCFMHQVDRLYVLDETPKFQDPKHIFKLLRNYSRNSAPWSGKMILMRNS